MAAYYNEIDPFAARWLRNLIAGGHIAPGEVDERSIKDVRPDDLKGFIQCHFFAGIGGWSYALRLAGWPDDRPVWTGSCPCQPFSLAGKQKGFDDSRHLWPEFARLIRDSKVPVIFGEQVASASDWLGIVRGDLDAMEYAVGTMPVEAACAGADHLRDRFWFVADDGRGRQSGTSWGQGEQPWRAETFGSGMSGIAMADAHDAGSQGRPTELERAGERPAGPDGMAHADRPVPCNGEEQRGRQQLRPGCDQEACDSGYMADGNGIGERGRPGEEGRQTEEGKGQMGQQDGERLRLQRLGTCDGYDWAIGADGKARRVKPGIRLLVNGFPARVGLLRGFGNAIDPRPAAAFIKAADEAMTPPYREHKI